MTVALPPRRLIGHLQSGELAVHALAQLPDDVTVEIQDGETNERLKLIATAYGVADRLSFSAANRTTPQIAQRTLAELVESVRRPDDGPSSSRGSDELLAGQRIALVTNLPTHYRVPLFNEMAARLVRAGAAFSVFFLAYSTPSRPWMRTEAFGFDHQVLRGVDLSRDRGRRIVPTDLERRLDAFLPTILLTGGFSPAVSLRVALYAGRREIPFGIWSGEHAARSTAQGRLRTRERKWLARRASYAVAYGSLSAEYLRALSPSLPIVLGRNTTIAPNSGSAARHRDTLEALVVGRAVDEKALDLAVEAVLRSPEIRCSLTVIGDGPNLAKLARLSAGDERIRLLGALASDQTLRAFSEADVFLFPRHSELYGLALVEAMGAGLATVTSPTPGAVADLCVSEHNCLIVENDPDAWAAALARLAGDHELRDGLGEAARRTIQSRWTIDHAAEAMLAGFRLGVLSGRPLR